MRKVLLLIVAATALGACHRGGADSGVSPPMRKAGLWETATTSDGQPLAAPRGDYTACVDDGADKRRNLFGGGRRGNCAKNAIVKGADGSYTIDRDCTDDNGMHTVSHTVISGDFNTKYVIQMDQTVDGSDNPDRNGQHARTTTATWLGACPAGMTPGQVMLADGTITNMRGMFGGGGGGGGNNAAGGGEGGGGQGAGGGGGGGGGQ